MMREPTAWPEDGALPCPPCEERRASVRLPSALRVTCLPLGGDDEVPRRALLRDVSATGAGLLLARPLPTRALIQIDLAAATRGAARALLARVVHSTPQAGGWLVGCAFVRELDDAALRPLGVRRVPSPAGDARRWKRFPCDVEAVCTPLHGAPGEGTPARVLDASAGGVGVALPREFVPGSLLTLRLGGVEGGGGPRELVRVVRVVRAAGGWFLGCEFADRLGDGELEALW